MENAAGLRLVVDRPRRAKAAPWRVRITIKTLPRIKLPKDRDEADAWDADCRGFGLRLLLDRRRSEEKGSRVVVRTWQVMYRVRGHLRRQQLGAVDGPAAITPETARKQARTILEQARAGLDPLAPAAPAGSAPITFGEVTAAYFRAKGPEMTAKSLKEAQRRVARELAPLLSRPMAAVTHAEVRSILRGIKSKTVCNRTTTDARQAVKWALEDEGMLTGATAAQAREAFTQKKLYKERGQGRPLTLDEIKCVWRAVQDEPGDFRDVLMLLFLTGVRLRQVLHMRRSEVYLDDAQYGPTWRVPGGRTKNKKPHWIPLSPAALEIVTRRLARGREFLFESMYKMRRNRETGETWTEVRPIDNQGRAAKRIKAKADAYNGAPLAKWRIHDIRHTVASTLANTLGVDPLDVALVLGHTIPLPATTARYAHLTRLPERRVILEKWAEWLLRQTAEADA